MLLIYLCFALCLYHFALFSLTMVINQCWGRTTIRLLFCPPLSNHPNFWVQNLRGLDSILATQCRIAVRKTYVSGIILNSIQFSLFPAHINISYNNNNVYILCRKGGGQKTMLMDEWCQAAGLSFVSW